MPTLYIISGCNGAGKTTASMTILPEILKCKEFVNADSIAAGLSPFSPHTVSFHAGRLMLERIEELLNAKETFAIETTLTTLSYLKLIESAKSKKYKIFLSFFYLKNVNLATRRVHERVLKGGHSVEKEIIERRYYRGIFNLFYHFLPLADEFILIDNSGNKPVIVSEYKNGIDIKFNKRNIWDEIIKKYEKTKREYI